MVIKFILRTLLIAGLAYLAARFSPLPWWSMAIIAFAVGVLFGNKPKKRRVHGKNRKHRPFSFWSGFIAIFCLWGGFAFWINMHNQSLLSEQIFQLFPLTFVPSAFGPQAMIFLTALLGGIVGGLSSLTGNTLGEAIK